MNDPLCWQDFGVFFNHLSPQLTFYTLWTLTKGQHFWTTYPTPLVNVVCERPLTMNFKIKENMVYFLSKKLGHFFQILLFSTIYGMPRISTFCFNWPQYIFKKVDKCKLCNVLCTFQNDWTFIFSDKNTAQFVTLTSFVFLAFFSKQTIET